MKKIGVILLVGLSAALSGCASMMPPPVPPVPMTQQFREADHTEYLKAGSASLTGQAFLRQQGGGVVTCAGSDVILLPATPFFQEVVSIMRTGREPQVARPLTEYTALYRKSQCDAQGNFVFANVPAGKYILMTQVQWVVGYNAQGGVLHREIDIPGSGVTNVLLTDTDRI